ncbi:hypothetical protein TRVA0_003S04192 [Trichomonascus vanleenenianus]|uniref:J domain-containing protein n=1 Tax=Trichomonascus vanleenenianus TaxID=2268995 RepID=UPI003EC9FD2B
MKRHFSTSRAVWSDPYKVLGLTPPSTAKQIKTKFYELSKLHHPDRTRSLPEPTQAEHRHKYQTIKDAYDKLSDPMKKASIDQQHGSMGPDRDFYGPTRDARAGRRSASGLNRQFRGATAHYYTKHSRFSSNYKHPDVENLDRQSSRDPHEVPHFDSAKHFQQHMNLEKHRKERMKEEERKQKKPDHHPPPSLINPTTITVVSLASLLVYGFFMK